MNPYESPSETEPPFDPHSGTRLVVALFILPLVCLAGWIAFRLGKDISPDIDGPDFPLKFAYACAALAMVATFVFCLNAWKSLRPQPSTGGEDELEPDDDIPAEWEED